jgi:hypothetical protein
MALCIILNVVLVSLSLSYRKRSLSCPSSSLERTNNLTGPSISRRARDQVSREREREKRGDKTCAPFCLLRNAYNEHDDCCVVLCEKIFYRMRLRSKHLAVSRSFSLVIGPLGSDLDRGGRLIDLIWSSRILYGKAWNDLEDEHVAEPGIARLNVWVGRIHSRRKTQEREAGY